MAMDFQENRRLQINECISKTPPGKGGVLETIFGLLIDISIDNTVKTPVENIEFSTC